MLIRLLVCGAMGAARLIELAYSRRNLQRGATKQATLKEGNASRATFPLIVTVHTTVILGTLLRGRGQRLPWLLALLAVQPLRLWVLLTLRERWNARGSVDTALRVATDGPYAHLRHPNYSVVAIELLSLPMAFGLPRLAAGASLFNAALLAIRVRDEERLLFDVPGYREHFEDKSRFLPGLF